jgi:hypothetical protein
MSIRNNLTAIFGLLLAMLLFSEANAMYAPSIGRFMSRDPIGYEGSDWGLYEFVDSQPLNNTDPKGLSGWIPFPSTPNQPCINPITGLPCDQTPAPDCVSRCMVAKGGAYVAGVVIGVQPTTSYPLKPPGRPLGAPTPDWSTPLRKVCGPCVRNLSRRLNPISNVVTVGGGCYLIGETVSCATICAIDNTLY